MKDRALAERCRKIRLLLTDVDGVMTDGTLLLLPGGGEGKSFHVRDGFGIVLAQRAGLRVGILSGRSSEVVSVRAQELGIGVVRQGILDKAAAFRDILKEEALDPWEVAYVGDDLNDLPVLSEVGLSAAPADAPLDVRSQVFMVLDAPGGRGCLREFVEAILRARGDWEQAVSTLGTS
ncbi:MAG TPA: HAD family hydrolase [Vicinamibacteria bacterium]|jgi:3-deoxy-D-manno-octulosonate 8-phosphate phosphatase (KDO 8-P phosphatase)|nr:HAD family hydrolase [Vicinamibacteria bacterium]